MIKTTKVEYHDEDVKLEGFYTYPDEIKGKQPAVLVCHDWSGRNQFACQKAEKLAELGYVGFALDMYGNGKIANTKDEKMSLIKPFMENREKLQKRILTAFEAVKSLEQVDSNKIGAIGFCFGGLCVLDLARRGVDIKGVVSFHGLLQPPENNAEQSIKAKILVLHGFDDPMATHDHIIKFGDEMTKAKADWEMDIYGNTMHAFTNPEANDPGFGTVYNKTADAHSWIRMKEFFKEVFKE